MADQVLPRIIGRVSEPSHTLAPTGALLRADNCVLRSAGILSQFPGTVEILGSPLPGAGGANFPYRTVTGISPLRIRLQTGTQTFWNQLFIYGSPADDIGPLGAWESDGGSEVQVSGLWATDSLVTPRAEAGYAGGANMYEARGNLYVPGGNALNKWVRGGDATMIEIAEGPFIVPQGSVVTLATPDVLAVNEHCGVRYVVRFKDENGVITRWAPSPVWIADAAGGAGSPELLLDPGASVDAIAALPHFDAIEIYRTRVFPNTVTLPNEYYLALTVDESNLLDYQDNVLFNYEFPLAVADAELGAALYTSSSQEGANAFNIAPPEHLHNASFRGHIFWADIAEMEQWEVQLPAGRDGPDASYISSITSGSPVVQISGLVADADFPPVGSYPRFPGFPADAQVVSFDTVANTVTMDMPATTTIALNAVKPGDMLVIGYPIGGTTHYDLVPLYAPEAAGVNNEPPLYSWLIDHQNILDPASPGVAVIGSRLRTARVRSAQVWIGTDNPEQYPDYPHWAPGVAGKQVQALHPRRIQWSKLQEPEHTTTLSFQDVGTSGRIRGLGGLKDALIILTDEGAWRLTGDNGKWRIDPVDTSVPVLGGKTTQVMDNAVFTLGVRGLLRVTSTEVTNLSDGIVDDWFTETCRTVQHSKRDAVRAIAEQHEGLLPFTCFAVAEAVKREYMLFMEPAYVGLFGVYAYPYLPGTTSALVYNAKTAAFTTFSPNDRNEYTIPTEANLMALPTCGAVMKFDPNRVGNAVNLAGQPPYDVGEAAPGIALAYDVADWFFDIFASPPFTHSLSFPHSEVHLFDNTDSALAVPRAEIVQDIATRAQVMGDSTHMKLWDAVVWDSNGEDTLTKEAVFQDGELAAEDVQAIDAVDGEEIRAWVPRPSVRSAKLVAGLRGAGIQLYGLRFTFASGGRESPLSSFEGNNP